MRMSPVHGIGSTLKAATVVGAVTAPQPRVDQAGYRDYVCISSSTDVESGGDAETK